MEFEKLDLASPDLVNQNFDKLAALFPNCVTESPNGKAIDFDLLKQELSHAVIEGNKERYRLEWPGKREAIVTANLPTTKTLRPIREDSVDFDNTENIYIEGDNLEVLKLLQESYLGKVKMIYIDPPYNTGNDFVYKDNFTQKSEEYKSESGEKDEYNQRLILNPSTSGRYHSDWLTMIYPRLKLARNLLRDDGVIFISIDDNEVHNLRKVCDEIFGEENMVVDLIWKSRQIVDSRNKSNASSDHESILCYTKRIDGFSLKGKEISLGKYSNPDNDPRGSWMSNSILGLANASQRPNLHYSILDPKTNFEFTCPPDTGWRYSKDTMRSKIEDGRIVFPKKEDGRPREKKFLSELGSRFTGFSSILPEDIGFTLHGSREVRDIFDGKFFDFPKPVSLVKTLVNQGTLSGNDIVLDFYSGSGTTAHAVLQLNAEDGGNRKFIVAQIQEAIGEDSEAFKAGYKNICEIGKERIRRSGNQIANGQLQILNAKKAELEKLTSGKLPIDGDLKVEQLKHEISNLEYSIQNLDKGFRVYRLSDSNMQDVYYKPQDYKQDTLDIFADNVKPDRTPDDLLAQIMLDWGLPLSLKIEQTTLAEKQVFKVAKDSLYACFDKGIDEAFAKEIAKEKPLRIVFKDSGFKDDTAKSNVRQLLKQLSPETEVKVI